MNAVSGGKKGKHEAIQCGRHELRGVQRARGEGRIQGGGRYGVLREPSDQFDGRGGHRDAGGRDRGGARGGLRRVAQGRDWREGESCGRGGSVGGSRHARAEAAAGVVAGIPDRADVFFHGAYDVELAAAGVLHGQPRGHGAYADASDDRHHGDQPQVLRERL